jgi:predicted helicase
LGGFIEEKSDHLTTMSTASLNSILDAIRNASVTERDKGTRFEILFKRFLEADSVFKERFSKVWLWQDWPGRSGMSDQGVDLVAQERMTGDYCAIQCKCYAPDYKLKLEDVGTFFACLSSSWRTTEGPQRFAYGMIAATTDLWTDKLYDTINAYQLTIPITRVGLSEMAASDVDWEVVAKGYKADPNAALAVRTKHKLKPHQKEAIEDVISGFQAHDRGKLIMACGTGKTFTSLRLAEQYTQKQGTVLFLVPSIALLSQALTSWLEQAQDGLYAIAVCSDPEASKKKKKGEDDADDTDLTSADLPWPACTDYSVIGKQYKLWKNRQDQEGGMIVIFSTYQSIDAVARAQEVGTLPEFDLIICDEAHRTTGVSLKNDGKKGGYDESAFVRVHNNEFLRGKKRLYMTATPRIYKEEARKKAEDNGALVASMDDESCYGPELHRLPFSKAVNEGLLADYKVLVLCVDEEYVKGAFQQQIASADNTLQLDDAVKLLGCYNGLRKKLAKIADSDKDNPELDILKIDPAPMQRAVAFAGRIKDSKYICEQMELIVDGVKELEQEKPEAFLPCTFKHVDGTMNSKKRNKLLSWLESGEQEGCRVLSNARCLSEGVDVPALDAVMFLSPRKSQVDIVQSVGRVMRTAPGKQYGYIILPIGIPAGMSPEEVLDNDPKYQVVWDVLQALRAHDDRFNAEINKIELNKKKGTHINVLDGTGRGD